MVSNERYASEASRQWALYPVSLARWLEKNPLERNPRVNTRKFNAGLALASISGDDSNCFLMGIQIFQGYAPDEELRTTLHDGRLGLLDRLDWEIHEPAIPRSIRQALIHTQGRIQQTPWNDRDSFDEARRIWTTTQRFVSDSIEDSGVLRTLLEYHHDLKTYVAQAYQANNSGN